jgi:hypothetical protein
MPLHRPAYSRCEIKNEVDVMTLGEAIMIVQTHIHRKDADYHLFSVRLAHDMVCCAAAKAEAAGQISVAEAHGFDQKYLPPEEKE